MSQLFISGGQSTEASASASVLPMNIQGWFPLGLTGLISLLSKRLSRLFFSTTLQKHQFFSTQPSLWSNSHIHTWLLEKTTALTRWTFLVDQTVKNLPAMQETWVLSLVWEDALEEDMATHPSILAWRIPMDRGAWRATVYGVSKSQTWLIYLHRLHLCGFPIKPL